jgi:hypothetical protein
MRCKEFLVPAVGTRNRTLDTEQCHGAQAGNFADRWGDDVGALLRPSTTIAEPAIP